MKLVVEPSAGTGVAVCLAGLVRTLVHPQVWRSAAKYLTLRGTEFELSSVAVLQVGSGSVHGAQAAWKERPTPSCELVAALRGLGVALELLGVARQTGDRDAGDEAQRGRGQGHHALGPPVTPGHIAELHLAKPGGLGVTGTRAGHTADPGVTCHQPLVLGAGSSTQKAVTLTD